MSSLCSQNFTQCCANVEKLEKPENFDEFFSEKSRKIWETEGKIKVYVNQTKTVKNFG